MTDTPDTDRGSVGGPRLSEEDRALAAEYVLRLLEPAEHADFEQRLGFSRELRDEVAMWQAHFGEVAETEVQPIAPRPQAKATLMRSLFEVEKKVSFWRAAGLWQGLAALSFGAVGVMGYLLTTQQEMPAPLLVGEISAQDDSLRLLVLYDGADGTLRITRTDGVSRPGRVLELWAHGPDDPPQSLGLLDASAQGVVKVPPALRNSPSDLILGISDEPAGGSPTGRPTGEIMAIGSLADL
ncbi:anti-sigma factor [Meridianimarinicoccus aquatilis]|uniref:Anti-sigma K factor RskA C-terminal domain-containing protein n=1 Tax=Meridianimarinicoccus aquatilis TaxID=2552766 RepID=A0A4R6AMZ2_9RHOB|nr:anti-sigma factor [Fluviibacterium aquatile]TDL84684.1 hypothetical protein E2L05_17470 [Fluviibacterium aquatile]